MCTWRNIDQLFKMEFPGHAKAAGLQSSQFANERMAIQQI
jgi:hypothetical protein